MQRINSGFISQLQIAAVTAARAEGVIPVPAQTPEGGIEIIATLSALAFPASPAAKQAQAVQERLQ